MPNFYGAANCQLNNLRDSTFFSVVRPPQSTRLSILRSAQKLAGILAIINGEIPNLTSYPKSTKVPFLSPAPAAQLAQRRPSFEICGRFSGNDGIPIARWQRKLEQEFPIEDRYAEKVQPFELLPAIDFLLTGVALEWAEENPVFFGTFTKSYPTAEDIEAIKRMINEGFLVRSVELSTQAFQNDPDSLNQKSKKSLVGSGTATPFLEFGGPQNSLSTLDQKIKRIATLGKWPREKRISQNTKIMALIG